MVSIKSRLRWMGRFHRESACETNLLAKDGIFLKDYPRALEVFPVSAAGRADIMVRCNVGTFSVNAYTEHNLLTIESVGPAEDSLYATTNFEWEFPDYLKDVYKDEVDDPNCSCTTKFTCGKDECKVNGNAFVPNEAVHRVEFRKLVERKLEGIGSHPYHQHVYPFQLSKGYDAVIDGVDVTHNGYFKNGDWHDIIRSPNLSTATIKYKADVHLGKLMLHCHRLEHEGTGMMSQEEIFDDGRTCACNIND